KPFSVGADGHLPRRSRQIDFPRALAAFNIEKLHFPRLVGAPSAALNQRFAVCREGNCPQAPFEFCIPSEFAFLSIIEIVKHGNAIHVLADCESIPSGRKCQRSNEALLFGMKGNLTFVAIENDDLVSSGKSNGLPIARKAHGLASGFS